MRLHENRELFSDALQAASQSVEDGGLLDLSLIVIDGSERQGESCHFQRRHKSYKSIRYRKSILGRHRYCYL